MSSGLGYVLIKCKKDGVEDVYRKVVAHEGVVEAYGVNGEYDILAKISAGSPTEIPRIVLQLRKIPGIVATKTLTVVNLEA
ncbi:MAG: Lrp/AsnC family transcriptional regulator [Euryarchaeota archaeon]|nr:Lrp/AsnC family transcriptional regulator [Euryarchaeota archaeon]